MLDNTCVCCGAVIPEGRQVCQICERKYTGGCTDCVHAVDGFEQCLIAKTFDLRVNPEHGCSWKVPIKRRAVQTNADRIRSMSDEELEDTFGSAICDMVDECNNDVDCKKCRLAWLKQEAKT